MIDEDDDICDDVTELLRLLLNPVVNTVDDNDDGAKHAEDTDNAVPVELVLLVLLLPLVDEFALLLYWFLITISLSVLLPLLRAPVLPRFRTVRLYKHLFNLTGSVPTGTDEFRFMFLPESILTGRGTLRPTIPTSRGIPLAPT